MIFVLFPLIDALPVFSTIIYQMQQKLKKIVLTFNQFFQ